MSLALSAERIIFILFLVSWSITSPHAFPALFTAFGASVAELVFGGELKVVSGILFYHVLWQAVQYPVRYLVYSFSH